MSLVVTEKASLANDDDSHTTSKGSRLEAGGVGSDGAQGAKGAQQVGENDKHNDNEKYAVGSQQRGLPPTGEPSQRQPSNGLTSNKSAGKVQEHKGGAGTESLRTDAIPLSASVRRPSTTSRFKEKRPEPLKLNPNQEIPLDLSVKSAGNVPSGNIFNLALINNLMGPLETPRIQWQDNDALLTSAKGRLFSSSTNASQRARLSSLAGDSPPITPGTPSMDTTFTPSGATSSTRPSGSEITTHSALHALELAQHPFLTSPNDLNKLRAPLINHHHHHHNSNKHNVRASDSKGTPRRSCSTDNLSARNTNSTLSVAQDGSETNTRKPNSVSPLATKSVSNQFEATANNSATATKFPYSNQQIATSKTDARSSPTSSSGSSIIGGNGKSLTPTSVANATANLLNIHLNSPNGNSSQSPVDSICDGGVQQQQQIPYKTSHFPEPSPLDPLLSAVSYCQQQQQQRSPFATYPSTSSSSDHFRHQSGLNSLSSSATLNTPTLISPSQLKAGHMCFLPSPTLSPMSSVFELPSPFLMFPPPSASTHLSQQQQQQQSNHQRGGTATTSEANKNNNNNKSPRGGESSQSDAITLQARAADVDQNQSDTSSASTQRRSCSEKNLLEQARAGPNANDLQQLITTAAQKRRLNTRGTTDNGDTNEDVNMDIDNEEDDTNQEGRNDSCPNERPATVIPQICVSNHHRDDQVRSVDGGAGRGSHWTRADMQRLNDERHESSSAPPEVYRPVWAKSKHKTILADSCFNLAGGGGGGGKNVAMVRANNLSSGTGGAQDKPTTSLSHSNINQSSTQRDRSTSKPYPVIRRPTAASSQQIQLADNSSCLETARSNSAEPAIYQRNSNALKVQHRNSPSSNSEFGCPSGQLYLKQNISSSVQHLTHAIKAESQSSASNSSHYHAQQPRQQIGQFPPSQQHQSQYQSQGLVYDQQQYYHRPQSGVQQRNEFGYGHQQQQNSISANDLHRLQNNRHTAGGYPPVVSSHMIAAAAAAVNNNNNGSSSSSVNSTSVQNHRANQPQQHFFQQNLQSIPLSPMNRFDTLQSSYNGYQQHFAQQQQQNMSNSTTANSASLLRLTEHQTSSHLLSNEALLRQQGTTVASSMATTRGDHVASFASDNAMAHCAGYHPLESESRSESRSSCSLDFTSSFSGCGGGSNSRLVHSSGGSSLVAKKYHCDHCAKSFTRSDMLTRHRRLHSGDRPFQCLECKQEFSRSDHLSTHMRTHTGEKPYKCKLCSYSACRKDMITRHLKVHNRNPHSVTEPM